MKRSLKRALGFIWQAIAFSHCLGCICVCRCLCEWTLGFPVFLTRSFLWDNLWYIYLKVPKTFVLIRQWWNCENNISSECIFRHFLSFIDFFYYFINCFFFNQSLRRSRFSYNFEYLLLIFGEINFHVCTVIQAIRIRIYFYIKSTIFVENDLLQ